MEYIDLQKGLNLSQALYYNVYTSLMRDPSLYFASLLIIVVALLPDVLIQVTVSKDFPWAVKSLGCSPSIHFGCTLLWPIRFL